MRSRNWDHLWNPPPLASTVQPPGTDSICMLCRKPWAIKKLPVVLSYSETGSFTIPFHLFCCGMVYSIILRSGNRILLHSISLSSWLHLGLSQCPLIRKCLLSVSWICEGVCDAVIGNSFLLLTHHLLQNRALVTIPIHECED